MIEMKDREENYAPAKTFATVSNDFNGENNRPKYRGRKKMKEWMHTTCEDISVHGMIWYTRTTSRCFRVAIIIFSLCIMVGLPSLVTFQSAEFATTSQISTVTEALKATMLKYPRLTVCHSKFFDKSLLAAYNISNNLANYMTMVLDLNVRDLTEYQIATDPNYVELMRGLDRNLQEILSKHRLSLVQLFRKVAFRCEDFVSFCEVHRKFLFSGNGSHQITGPKCCDQLFDPRPKFAETGTCYTTNKDIWENFPFTFSSVKVWMDFRSAYATEFELKFKGSDAVERNDVYFSVSDDDYPVAVLAQYPYKATRGTVTLVGLSIKETDRRQLGSKFCQADYSKFQAQYGIPYTKLNCEMIESEKFLGGCSLNQYYGLDFSNDSRPCTPRDLLNLTSLSFDDESFNESKVAPTNCAYECFHVDYMTKITTGNIDMDAMIRHVKEYQLYDGDISDTVVLQLHYTTFDYIRHVMLQESFVNFLSKVGGWFGLAVGASIISFVEIAYFIFRLVHSLCSKEKLIPLNT